MHMYISTYSTACTEQSYPSKRSLAAGLLFATPFITSTFTVNGSLVVPILAAPTLTVRATPAAFPTSFDKSRMTVVDHQ